MEISKYKNIADLIEKNEQAIINAIQDKSAEQQYFKQFTTSSLSPGKIVTESFVNLLKLSIRMGDTAPLKEQYAWTKQMLGARGVGLDMFISFFTHFIDLSGEVTEGLAGSEEEKASVKELFCEVKEEFVNTVQE